MVKGRDENCGNVESTVAAVVLYRILTFWAVAPWGWAPWGTLEWTSRHRAAT